MGDEAIGRGSGGVKNCRPPVEREEESVLGVAVVVGGEGAVTGAGDCRDDFLSALISSARTYQISRARIHRCHVPSSSFTMSVLRDSSSDCNDSIFFSCMVLNSLYDCRDLVTDCSSSLTLSIFLSCNATSSLSTNSLSEWSSSANKN